MSLIQWGKSVQIVVPLWTHYRPTMEPINYTNNLWFSNKTVHLLSHYLIRKFLNNSRGEQSYLRTTVKLHWDISSCPLQLCSCLDFAFLIPGQASKGCILKCQPPKKKTKGNERTRKERLSFGFYSEPLKAGFYLQVWLLTKYRWNQNIASLQGNRQDNSTVAH